MQLHVVQEMVEFIQAPSSYFVESPETSDDMELNQIADVMNPDALQKGGN